MARREGRYAKYDLDAEAHGFHDEEHCFVAMYDRCRDEPGATWRKCRNKAIETCRELEYPKRYASFFGLLKKREPKEQKKAGPGRHPYSIHPSQQFVPKY